MQLGPGPRKSLKAKILEHRKGSQGSTEVVSVPLS